MIQQDELDKLTKQHGELILANTRMGQMAFRTPTLEEHERWIEKVAADKDSKSAATREYVLAALVHPTRDDAKSIFEKQPALPPKIADRLAKLAGADVEFETKKA